MQSGKDNVLEFTNYDLENLITPVNSSELDELLKLTNYDAVKTKFLVNGFNDGFDLGCRGPQVIQQTSRNLRFTIGNKRELWNKVMKEVELGRYAGPYEQIPFDNYIQSPIGLVPKDGGTKTRLIFHLSHPRDPKLGFSVNANTPKDMTPVTYKNFDAAVNLCIHEGRGCFAGKSDMSSAFRHFCIARQFWQYLVMKAYHPITNKIYYFVDKCMPFGAAISCSHFQEFSDAISHIVKVLTRKENVNYLDDFLFAALMKAVCDGQIKTFINICEKICFPVAMDKTFWGCTRIIFLGLIIDTVNQIICIPIEKVNRAKTLIQTILSKKSGKLTKHELQKLTGFLNFLCKAVVPGRVFTRRLYSLIENSQHLRQHHHISLTGETKADLRMWLIFLNHPSVYARKFIDLNKSKSSTEVDFYTDASANPQLGCGGVSGSSWFILQWDEEFVVKFMPSINYLELYAVTIGIFNWLDNFRDRSITIFCDNLSVVQMINKNSSKCKQCMVLLQLIVLKTLTTMLESSSI